MKAPSRNKRKPCQPRKNQGDKTKGIIRSEYLSDAERAEPIPIWHLHHLGSMAIEVAATVTAITQQQILIIIPFSAHKASLESREDKNE